MMQSTMRVRGKLLPQEEQSHFIKVVVEKDVSKPLVVSIPHNLGQEEALRRMKAGLANVRSQYGHFFTVNEETWNGNQLNFRISAIAQETSGLISVENDHVRLEIVLPWLLARIASNAQALIRDKGRLMLEKK